MRQQVRIAALSLALVGAFCACSGPSTKGSAQDAAGDAGGRRVLVGLYDSKGPIHLDLANASHPELADVYSHQRQDAVLKLAPDELMQDLLGDLAQLSFASLATAGGPPPDGAPVRGWVSVDDDGVRRTFVVPVEGASRQQLEAFVGMKLVINEYYTHVGALQYVTNPEGHDIFRRQQ